MFVGKTGSMKGFEEYGDFIDINEKALLNILNEYKSQNSSAKIIFPSTRLVYKGKKGLIDENGEKEFKTIYSVNKYACEQYLNIYNNLFGVSFVVFRICVPYGTLVPNATSYGTAEFMLNNAFNSKDIILYGTGEMRRTILHIKDLCNILILGALSKECMNTTFNIGGENVSLFEMANLIAKKYKVSVNFVPWTKESFAIESGDTVFDSNKLDSILNYTYEYTFAHWIE
jgi:UDP-glucose 4-epimerase